MCLYFAKHIRHEYQLTALQKLTGIGSAALSSTESTALYLEQWLLEQNSYSAAARPFPNIKPAFMAMLENVRL